MMLNKTTLKKLGEIINGDNTKRYRSGPKLVEFFNQLGFFDDYYNMEFPSRREYTDEKLAEINDTYKLKDCIKLEFQVIDYIENVEELDALIANFNKYLAFDKWKIVRNNEKIELERIDKIIIPDESEEKKMLEETEPEKEEKNYVTNIYGAVNQLNLQQGDKNNIQNIKETFNFEKVVEGINKIVAYSEHFDQEFGKQSQSIQKCLSEILQLAEKHENPGKIKQLADFVKDSAAGATGSVLAPGIVYILSNLF